MLALCVDIENILRAVMKKMSTKQVSFQIILCNCRVIERHIEEEAKYDRILTGNLMDYIMLPHLLEICSRKLDHENSFATIVTQTQNWTRDFCPEASFVASMKMSQNMKAKYINLKRRALEDTKNPRQIDGGNAVMEYLDNSAEFIDFLRALFYAFSADPIEIPKVPTVKVLGNEFQLKLRDCFRNENRIAVFKMAVNRRRVTMITGLDRSLEWVSLHRE